jgi:putative oxidoreductase
MPDTHQFEGPALRNTRPGNRIEDVRGSGIYPVSGPLPAGPAEVRGQGEFGHPEQHRATRLLPGSRVSTFPLLLGRAMFGGFFLYNGINHFLKRKMMTEYASSKNVAAADVAVLVSGAMIAAGGLSLMAGVRPKVGASLIAGFLVGVSPVMHAFWRHDDPQQKMNEMVHFSKNLALLGGVMLAAAVPEPWPVAVNA